MSSFLWGTAFRLGLSPTKQYLCLNTFPLLLSVRNETHYDVLKLPRCCTSKEIRDAFISLSKENHPDKNRNDPSMHTRFVKINEAYRTLIKPSSRHAYDMTLGSKRKLGPPYTSTSSSSTSSSRSSTSYEDDYIHVHQHDFNDPYMWTNTKKEKQTTDDYYGIKGVKKVSNTVIVWLIIAFTIVGVSIQVVIISVMSSKRNRYMMEESRKNSILENMLKERAKLYGNEHQIQVLKNSLRASYNFDEDNENKQKPKSDN